MFFQDAFFGKELLISCKKLGKSSDGHEDAIKEGAPKVDSESSNVKPQLQEVTAALHFDCCHSHFNCGIYVLNS